MQVHFGVELLHAEWSSAVTCVGTFDGVHLGHREVIGSAISEAKSRELPCCLVTFDRHPAAILAPERCPKAIASMAENLQEFARLGVSVAVVLPFDLALSETSATDFLREILVGKLKSDCLVVGHDFALGHGREGTAAWLSERIETHTIPPFEMDGQRVSSSMIRQAVEKGDVQEAGRLLGRPFEITGVVVGGQRLGRTLGYPTANLARSFDQVMPADGIYGGYGETSLGRFKAAISIGTRPAVGGGNKTIEAYLLGYPGDSLYGRTMALQFLHRLRDEQNFDSLDALKAQIARDVSEVARVLDPVAS